MATYTWSIPTGKAIIGTTYIKDTDNKLSDTIDDLVDFVNGTGAHAGQGLTYDLVDKTSVQTISGVKTFSSPIAATGGVTGDVTGNVVGNSSTATTLQTSRTITVTGDISAPATAFNGSANITLTASFRTGMIMMWSGSVATIPSGWYLCDGTNGTPNLLGRSIIAAGGTYSVGQTGNGSIPSHSHTMNHDHPSTTTSSNGAHTHTLDTAGSTGAGSAALAGIDNGFNYTTTSNGAHTHTLDVPNYTGSTGTAGSGTEVIPKFYALCFIMKG